MNIKLARNGLSYSSGN